MVQIKKVTRTTIHCKNWRFSFADDSKAYNLWFVKDGRRVDITIDEMDLIDLQSLVNEALKEI